jgi:uncharacterized protein (DUF1330 family)
MAKGYWIVRVDIADPEKYKAYTTANAKPFARYGARFLARAGRFECVEGAARARNAIIEFPSYEAALECWHSAEYQEVMKLRTDISTIDPIVIEGYDGPQPGDAR